MAYTPKILDQGSKLEDLALGGAADWIDVPYLDLMAPAEEFDLGMFLADRHTYPKGKGVLEIMTETRNPGAGLQAQVVRIHSYMRADSFEDGEWITAVVDSPEIPKPGPPLRARITEPAPEGPLENPGSSDLDLRKFALRSAVETYRVRSATISKEGIVQAANVYLAFLKGGDSK